MIAPPPRNQAEYILRDEIDSVLSGSCSSAIEAPLFALGESETSFVNCATGLPLTDGDLYKMDEDNVPSTYGEITVLGSCHVYVYGVCCWILPYEKYTLISNFFLPC
jgi:hypothetical protein